MGFLDALVNFVEDLGKDETKEEGDSEALKHVATRLADSEEAWVKEEIRAIILEVATLVSSSDLLKVEKQIQERLHKFATDCFLRGAKAASRMNVISK